jgi:P22_AR N-terminal domain
VSARVVKIPFHGTELIAVDVDGKPQIVLRAAVESLGLAFEPQRRKLQSRSWAVVTQKVVTAADGKGYQTTTVDVRTFLMLLATINENNVAAEKRELLVAYQSEVADVVEAYWRNGVVANPRSIVPVQPSRLDVVQALLDEVRRIESESAEARAIAQRTSDRLDAIEGKHDWFAAVGYARQCGLPTHTRYLQRLGKQAAAIARTHGVEPNPVQHQLYGVVNSFPVWIWDLAAEGISS